MHCLPTRPVATRYPEAGYTLIELLVTVVLVAVLAAFAIPMYQGYIKTSHQERVMLSVRTFTMFEQSYFIDNQEYLPGLYEAGGGTNDFRVPLGYRVSSDNDFVSLQVEAGACGDIAKCYRVIAWDTAGTARGTFEASTGTWTWDP